MYNTLIPPSHESPAVGLRISRLSGPVELTLRYTTPDIHCRHRRHECDGGITGDQQRSCAELRRPQPHACTLHGNLPTQRQLLLSSTTVFLLAEIQPAADMIGRRNNVAITSANATFFMHRLSRRENSPDAQLRPCYM